MSIIQAIRDFVFSCPFVGELVLVDSTDEKPENVGVMPTGETTVELYMDGSAVVQYNFSLYARRFTPQDLDRLENAEFVERFRDWIRERNQTDNLPALPDGMTAESITCSGGMLFDIDETGASGLYQIQCQLTYEREG